MIDEKNREDTERKLPAGPDGHDDRSYCFINVPREIAGRVVEIIGRSWAKDCISLSLI